jgi:HD superfamily phosphohydrolase
LSLQHTFTSGRIWEPLYQWELDLHPIEIELFQSSPVRRLKYLHHFGASALFSPIVHSRLEHTVGVWSLMVHFFPNEPLLRIAAILHDIGHLPFSHAVEKTLGFDHHAHTKKLIENGPVAHILNKYGLSSSLIISILSQDNPLSNQSPLLGLDHLDSFLRDTYAAGKYDIPPYQLVKKLRFQGNFLEADPEIAFSLISAIVEDHRMFLHPQFLAMDALLAKAVTHHCESSPGARAKIPGLVDHDLIHELQQSADSTARELIKVLLYEPQRIQISEKPSPGSIQVQIRKLYKKQPLIGGKPASEVSPEVAAKLEELDTLTASYFFTYA